MGHQLNFYLTEQDSQRFESELLAGEDSLIIHNRSRGPFPRVVESTDLVDQGQREVFSFLARRTDLDLVVMKEIPTQGYWTIDDLRSPVVQLIRSVCDRDQIKRGRLFYDASYYDQTGKLVSKDTEFIKWAKGTFSRARRLLTYNRQLGAYLGAEAVELSDKGARFVDV